MICWMSLEIFLPFTMSESASAVQNVQPSCHRNKIPTKPGTHISTHPKYNTTKLGLLQNESINQSESIPILLMPFG
jgi:hypothetical protein